MFSFKKKIIAFHNSSKTAFRQLTNCDDLFVREYLVNKGASKYSSIWYEQ